MRYRIKYFADGYEYYPYINNPPANTEGWQDVAELPQDIKDAQEAAKQAPSRIALLEQEVAKLKADVEALKP